MTTAVDRTSAAAPDSASADPQEVERFAGEMFESALRAVELVNVALGLRLGLYEALVAGPATPVDLAGRAGIGRRHAREWLQQQAAAGVLEVERAEDDGGTAGEDEARYHLPAARAHVLLQRDSQAYMGATAESAVIAGTWLPMLEPAYRDGTGVPYAAYGVHDLQAAFTRPQFTHELLQTWLPALPDIHARLMAGAARVAEIGCGEGLAAVLIARGFPGVVVHGYDLDDASVAAARRHAEEAGVAGRVQFEVADALTLRTADRYDLVFCVEVLHDVADPVGVLAAMRRARSDDGAVLVVDERVAESFAPPVEPVERFLYAFSTLHCLPVGLAGQPSTGTGAVMRAGVVRRYARAAGFSSVEELPVEHPQFRLYRLDG